MPDRRLVEDVAARLDAEPALVEKDWHIVRTLGALAAMNHSKATPIFSGGTSLSIGWGLIKRFSGDVDFRVVIPEGATKSATERDRRNYGSFATFMTSPR